MNGDLTVNGGDLELLDNLHALTGFNDVDLGFAACAYAELGIPVFPCKPGAKNPNTKNGLLDATTDTTRLERWWANHPFDNIGLVCGEQFDVLDIDVAKDKPGLRNAKVAEDAGLLDGWIAMQATPSGGRHLLFLPTDGLRNTVRATIGLDVRAKGGYILAAPSAVLGVKYNWVKVSDGPYGHLGWEPLLELLLPRPTFTAPRGGFTSPSSIAPLEKFVANAKEGERNFCLFWAACRATEGGFDPMALLPAALSAGLTESESKLTIASARKKVSGGGAA